jgi:branched-chain amino acid transport system permease protein
LLFGYTGLLSFGQAGFFGVGAYACAKILLAVPNLFLGILGGVAAAGVAALVLGILSVRHTRIYFSMLTLAFGMMIFSIAWKWRDFTGGDDGLVGIPRAPLEIPGVFSLSVAAMDRYYYVVLVLSLLAIYAMYRLVRSPLGLTLQAIRDSETRAQFAGVPVRKYRLVAFTIAGLYAGLAGALLTPLENTVTPPVAHWTMSAEPVLATLMGGIHTFTGPVVGSILFILIKDVVMRFTEYWLICFGVIVVAMVMCFPSGIMSLFEHRRRAAAATPAEPGA